MIDNILKWRNTTTPTFSNPFCPNNYRGWPSYWENQRYNDRQGKDQPWQSWNSSTAPRNMNNMPVPMDVDRARTYQGWGFQGRVAALNEPGGPKGYNGWGWGGPSNAPRGPCFECGQMGHFAWNCPWKPHRANINLIDFQEEGPSDNKLMPTLGKVASIKEQLIKMTDEEREELAKEMGVAEDFPTA
jgi:zinc knuckle protein